MGNTTIHTNNIGYALFLVVPLFKYADLSLRSFRGYVLWQQHVWKTCHKGKTPLSFAWKWLVITIGFLIVELSLYEKR